MKTLLSLFLILCLLGCATPKVHELYKIEENNSIRINQTLETINITKETKKLPTIEVKEYKGERLDSTSKFRENSIKGPQNIDIGNYQLTVDGIVNNPTNFLYSDILKMQSYEKIVTLYCVEGWQAKILWKGVLLKDILKQVNVSKDANTVIFYAVDGYSSALPLDYIIDNNIMLAYNQNGQILKPERGFPFQLVAENKWGYKWVKWIDRIALSNNPDYKGFWEQRGYNQNGSLEGSKFEDRG